MKIIVPFAPKGKPRMTRRDQWKARPCVIEYREYCDRLREHVGTVECSGHVSWKAVFPLPKSWSKKKKREHAGEIHQQKPDRDNIDKGILDALFQDDSIVAVGLLEKYWDDGNGARLELEIK